MPVATETCSGQQQPAQGFWAGLFLVPLAAALTPVDQVLAGMVAAGQGVEALCLFLSLTPEALFERIVMLGLPTPHDRPMRRLCGKRPWVASDVHQLIRHWIEGVRIVSIAAELGRSPGAVSAKARRLGLPKRNRSRLIRLEPITRPAKSNPPAAPDPCQSPTPPATPGTYHGEVIRSANADAAVSRPLSGAGESTEPVQTQRQQTQRTEPDRDPQAAPVHQEGQTSGTATILAFRKEPAAPQIRLPLIEPRPEPENRQNPQGEVRPVSQVHQDEDKNLPKQRKQSRVGQKTWTPELEYEVSLHLWANQTAGAAAHDFAEHGISSKAISAKLSRWEIPRRVRAELVEFYDPAVAQRNIRQAGYKWKKCQMKNRHVWMPRCETQSEAWKRSPERQALSSSGYV